VYVDVITSKNEQIVRKDSIAHPYLKKPLPIQIAT
jgi:hypothetical protein